MLIMLHGIMKMMTKSLHLLHSVSQAGEAETTFFGIPMKAPLPEIGQEHVEQLSEART